MSDCINWTGLKWAAGRYGMDTINKVDMGAHRAAWIRKFGPIPSGLLVCHKCDNGLCVNTDHLFLGTAKDNMQDCKAKGRLNRGSQKGSKNHNARSDYEYLRKRAKQLRAKGLSYNKIKQKLSLKSNGHVRNLVLS